MAIKQKYDCCAARKYQGGDGTEKTQWVNVGRAVEWDDGGIEIELTSVPVGSWWNGKIKLFKPKNNQAQGGQRLAQGNGNQPVPADF